MTATTIPNIGYYFENFFGDRDIDYFKEITTSHKFQTLTESNKPGVSHRKGIYLSNVSNLDDQIHFNLMRCSTNFEGPTEEFASIDRYIIDSVNKITKSIYGPEIADLNHVLAQIYCNKKEENKEKKARIKSHSDKTKDMSPNSIIAFCTFYDNPINDEKQLTKIIFKHKYAQDIDVNIPLGNNSLLIIPLETNRLYTHKISPSILPIDRIPTRLGYVIRSSHTNAIYKNDKVYVIKDDKEVELVKGTEEDVEQLVNLYMKENNYADIVDYTNIIEFSLNEGDYKQPIRYNLLDYNHIQNPP